MNGDGSISGSNEMADGDSGEDSLAAFMTKGEDGSGVARVRVRRTA